MDFVELLNDLGAGLLYGLVGVALLALGYLVIDLLTPGNLGELVITRRHRSAGLIVAAGLIAIGAIVATAIATSDDRLGEGLAESAGFGLLGILLLAIAFVVVDAITPGRLGETVTEEGDQPAAMMTAAAMLSVGAIVAAPIS